MDIAGSHKYLNGSHNTATGRIVGASYPSVKCKRYSFASLMQGLTPENAQVLAYRVVGALDEAAVGKELS